MITWQIPREARIQIAVAALVLEPDLTVARAARRTGLSHTEVGAAWRAAHGPRPRRFPAAATEARIEPFAQLCDEMAAALTERPQTARQLFARFAEVHERRLWRALHRLVASGKALRHGTRCAGSTYTRGAP